MSPRQNEMSFAFISRAWSLVRRVPIEKTMEVECEGGQSGIDRSHVRKNPDAKCRIVWNGIERFI